MKNSKISKILMLVIALSIVFTMTASAVVFTDISSHWAKSYIERVAERGLVTGYSNKTFKPDNNVTVLESLVMMSRLYDIDEDLKEEIVEKYESALEAMPNSTNYKWAFENLSVIIELGVVSETGVRDMFTKKTIFNDATREEIAVLLTNAMLLGDEAKELKVYSLPFSDREKISTVARPYIYVMYDKGIFQGDSKKNINPLNKITRAEISALLDKAYNYIDKNDVYPEFDDYVPTTVIEGVITKISNEKAESYIYIKNSNGVESIVKINNDTSIYINGKVKKFTDLKVDMIVSCKIDESRLAIKVEADATKQVVRGTIEYVAFSEPASITINNESNKKVKYNVPTDAEVYLDGKKTQLKNLDEDDEIEIFLDNDKVYKINSISRIKHFDGEITAIDYSSYPIKISIKTTGGVIKTFVFNSDVSVTRNDEKSSFDRVRIGDDVTITTEYDELIKINTVAKEAEMSGTIKEIIISSENKIKIADKDGDVTLYTVSNNVVITIGSKNASIYDLRLGYNVNVNTSGDEIVTIEASELQTAMNFAGKIIFFNPNDKLIMMQNVNNNGQKELVYLRVTNSTKIFNISGENKYLKDIKEGNSIISTAITQGGEFVAVSIMIQ